MRIVRIGRNPDNDIILNHPTVSGAHAEVHIHDNGQMLIVDHSTNGTYIDNTYLHNASRPLYGQETLRLPGNNLIPVSLICSNNNNSGAGGLNVEPKSITPSKSSPGSLNNWNWGAFYFGWLWAVCHKIYWPLVCLIPYVGQVAAFIICIFLGAKGNQWAWEKYERSAEEFEHSQHSWAVAACICFIITLFFLAAFIVIFVTTLT